MTSTGFTFERKPAKPLDRVRAVFFDFDGTLIPSEHLYLEALVQTLIKRGSEPDRDTVRERVVGHTTEQSRKLLNEAFPVSRQDQFFEKVETKYLEALKESGLHLGVLPLCDRLSQANIHMAIVTNSTQEELQINLKHLPELPHLQEHFTHGNGHLPKPAPDLYQEAARHYGVGPEQCLAVEDSVTGVTAALKAGMSVAVYDPERSFPIDTFRTTLNAERVFLVRTFSEIGVLLGFPRHIICSDDVSTLQVGRM